jgi:photosystem II stability/assembly factor-like uncharacterized protein
MYMPSGVSVYAVFRAFILNSVLVVLLTTGVLHAQWSRCTDVQGGRVQVLYSNDNEIWAMISQELFRSSDNGQTWAAVVVPDRVTELLTTIAKKDSVIVLGANDVVYSTDNGTSWTLSDQSGRGLNRVFAVDNGFYIAGADGLFYCTDIRSRWEKRSDTLAKVSGSSSPVNEMKSVGGLLYANLRSTLYKSSDGGRIWKKCDGRSQSIYANNFAIYRQSLLALTRDSVYESTDAGDSWAAISSDSVATKTATSFFADSAFIYVGGYGGVIYRSSTGGRSWENIRVNETGAMISSIASIGTTLFAGSLGGLFKRDGWNGEWKACDAGQSRPAAAAMASVDSMVFVLTESNGVYASSDHGKTWKHSSPPFMMSTRGRVIISAERSLFVCTDYSGLYRSTNYGATWDSISLPAISIYDYVTSIAVSGDTWYAGFKQAYPGVYRSTDLGRSWERVDNPSFGIGTVSSLIAAGDVVLAGVDYRGVYKSTDRGSTWNADDSLRPGGSVLYYHRNIAFAYNQYGIVRSTDLFTTWTDVSRNEVNTMNAKMVSAPDAMYRSRNASLYKSTNDGESWFYISDIPAGTISQLSYDGRYIIAISSNGKIYRMSADDTATGVTPGDADAAVAADDDLRIVLAKEIVSPDNIRPVSFHIDTPGRYSLEAFSAAGVRTGVLLNEYLEAGWATRVLDIAAHDLPSGMCLLRLSDGGHSSFATIMVAR